MSGTNGVPDPNYNSTWAWDHRYYNRAARDPAAWDPTDDDTFALLAANSLEVILDERAPDLAKKQPPAPQPPTDFGLQTNPAPAKSP